MPDRIKQILKQLFSAKYNHSHLNKTPINTELITKVANSLESRPPNRSIVSFTETLAEHISGYDEYFLQAFQRDHRFSLQAE